MRLPPVSSGAYWKMQDTLKEVREIAPEKIDQGITYVGRHWGPIAARLGIRGEEVAGGIKYSTDFNSSISQKRAYHILYGDSSGGGHLWPGASGKTPFPQDWTPEKILKEVSAIAIDPDIIWKRADGKTELYYKSGKPARFSAISVQAGVTIKVIIEPAGEGIITAHPVL